MVGAYFTGRQRRSQGGHCTLSEVSGPIVDLLEPSPCLAPALEDLSPRAAARLAPLLEVGTNCLRSPDDADRHAHRRHVSDHVATLVHHHAPG